MWRCLVTTSICHRDGPRRPADLIWAAADRPLAQNAALGALPVLYAAVPGNSLATAQDPDLARHQWTISEQLTGSAPRSSRPGRWVTQERVQGPGPSRD